MNQITPRSDAYSLRYTLLTAWLLCIHSLSSLATENPEPLFACTGTIINSFPYTEGFENSVGDWVQTTAPANGDTGNWTRDANGTPSNNTGPRRAPEGLFYLFTEASNTAGSNVGNNGQATLTSPCFDLTTQTSAFFHFTYHMYGFNTGSLTVQISDDAGASWSQVFGNTGQQQTGSDASWITENIDLTAYLGSTVNIRIIGNTGNGFRSDIAIDNVGVAPTPVYCPSSSSPLDMFNDGISEVIFNTINNPSPTGNYTDFTGISTTVEQGSTHDLSVRINNPGNNNFRQRAWIDWNQDYDFDDAGEEYDLGSVLTGGNNQLTSNSPVSITVPLTAQLGDTRMRITNAFNFIPDACSSFSNGEVEDYTITVISNIPQPEMDVSGLATSIANGDMTPALIDDTDFGAIIVGNSNARIFTITNLGNLDLNLTDASPYVTITGSPNFTVTAVPNSVVPSGGGTTTFEITYTPTIGGTDTATVSIANNDADENPYTFAVSANGIGPTPEIGLTGLGNNILNGDTTPTTVDGTDFGNLLTGSNTFRDFVINNTGTVLLNLTGGAPYVTITGTDAAQFTLTTAPSTPIAPGGGSSTFRITYNPSSNGTHNATVTIANDDDNEDPFTYDITGFASDTLMPDIDVLGLGNSITNNDTTPSISDNTDFGVVEIGTANTNDFVISNNGTGLLTLTTASPYITILGPDASEFLVTTIPNNTIEAGNTTTFQISYAPTSIGTHNAIISIENDDATEDPYHFNITGEGVAAVTRLYTVYYENFDADQGNWVISNPGGQTVWTYGQNAGETTGDGNYFYTNNYNNYTNNSDTYVTSPIIDLSGFVDLRLQIDIRTILNNDFDDAMNMEYSSNGGSTWTVLGTTTEPVANSWYNETDADGLGNGIDGWAGINASVFDTNKSQFSLSYVDLPTSLENNAQAMFRVRFASDNDGITDDGANFDNIIITGNPITPIGDPNEGPANVTSNLQVWLKSNAGLSIADGTPANLWSDQARDNDAARGNKNAPTYFNNATENINHNPVLSFNEASQTELKGKGGYFSQDYWIVMRQEGSINGTSPNAFEGVVGARNSNNQFSEDGSGFWTGNISIRFNGENNMLSHMVGSTPATVTTPNTSYGRAYSSSTDSYTDEVIIINVKADNTSRNSEIYKNGIRVDNTDAYAFDQITNTQGDVLPYADYINAPYVLGVSYAGLNRQDISTWFNGKITEFISYSAANSVFDQKRIQSYLAIKNGVTLHSIHSTTVTREGDEDYVDSDGDVIWDYITHQGFNYDIAGIGRDDASGLNQKQSTSSNPGATITMGLTDIYETNAANIVANSNTITDQNFLMWGNNNDSFAETAPISVDMSAGISGLNTLVDFTSVQRIWKVVEKGAIGTVKVAVPEAMLSATLDPPGNYFMFISDTPSFSPTSEYRVMKLNGSNLEALYDFNGVKYVTFGYAPEYYYERSITFDGIRDFLQVGDALDRTGAFTISAWIKRIDRDYSIISKRNAAYTEGYDISLLNNNRIEMSWINGNGTQDIQSTVIIPEGTWHQFAFTYDGTSEAKVYIDGVLDNIETLSPPLDTNHDFIIGAADGVATTDFYRGTLDEVRIWDIALTENQLRFIMNQEIEENTDLTVAGLVVPTTISKNELSFTNWSSLAGYFPMNRYTFTNVTDQSNNNLVAAIRNLETVDFQTAPLPYVSQNSGSWTNVGTWEHGTTQELPGAVSIVDNSQTVDWNIVQTSHDISTTTNNTVLSLEVFSNELSIENESKIEISHYLKLDGVIDLVDESQLVQTENSDLDSSSVGYLERDQQGTSDNYTYNIWSAPVSTINGATNNQDYTVSNIMLDGSDADNPINLQFTGGLDGAPGAPIVISAFWLYKFTNDPAGDYSSWQYTGPTGAISPGEGYTMKGPGTGSILDPQNYTYVGKPNNSTDTQEITFSIDAGNQYLIGNPFPSALDANDFIMDNPHLDGTLHFWQHWGGGTHVLAGYQGGYATYTLAGGVPAVSHPSVDQTGSGTITPGRYIPVGQGFFTGATTTGTIVLNNSQRNFVKETSGNSFFFFTGNQAENTTNSSVTANEYPESLDDSHFDAPDIRQKFRIQFHSAQQYTRELLLTVDKHSSLGYDRMYDGFNAGGPEEDMKWIITQEEAVIQAINKITHDLELPLRIVTTTNGVIGINITDIENEDLDISVFIKDALHNTYTDIKNDVFNINLEAGEYNNRFFVVFHKEEQENTTTRNGTTLDTDNETVTATALEQPLDKVAIDLNLDYNAREKTITITNDQSALIQEVRLYTVLGQIIKRWSPNTNAQRLELPAQAVSTGAYLVQILTENGTRSKKLIIH